MGKDYSRRRSKCTGATAGDLIQNLGLSETGKRRVYRTHAVGYAMKPLTHPAALVPNHKANTLTVRIHHMASPVHNRAIVALLTDINALDFRHPATGDRIVYSLVWIPEKKCQLGLARDQVV